MKVIVPEQEPWFVPGRPLLEAWRSFDPAARAREKSARQQRDAARAEFLELFTTVAGTQRVVRPGLSVLRLVTASTDPRVILNVGHSVPSCAVLVHAPHVERPEDLRAAHKLATELHAAGPPGATVLLRASSERTRRAMPADPSTVDDGEYDDAIEPPSRLAADLASALYPGSLSGWDAERRLPVAVVSLGRSADLAAVAAGLPAHLDVTEGLDVRLPAGPTLLWQRLPATVAAARARDPERIAAVTLPLRSAALGPVDGRSRPARSDTDGAIRQLILSQLGWAEEMYIELALAARKAGRGDRRRVRPVDPLEPVTARWQSWDRMAARRPAGGIGRPATLRTPPPGRSSRPQL